ncbi:MAG: winged helix-turn-helix domain-containing protein, partial [Eubacteriales bacterium]|nr:winged helix-turn-helix domain-containing protein [Eubacteriales bacterium]
MKAENAVPILRELIENGRLSQRQLADRCGLSLGTVNHVVNRAIKKKYLERREEGLYVTEAGFDWLVPYQVKNA